MATVVWKGDSKAIAQVVTVVVGGTWATGDTATITLNGKGVTFTCAATQTIAAMVAGLVAAWNASTEPEHSEITATDASPNVVLTADTAGMPFCGAVTASEVSAAGTISPSTTTASSGPYDLNVAANWDTGALPANTNDVVFENTAAPCKYSLSSLPAIVLSSLSYKASDAADLGLPRVHSISGVGDYVETRATYLAIAANTTTIGEGSGSATRRCKVNYGNTVSAVTVFATGAKIETGIPAVLLQNLAANSTLTVHKGSVGVALFSGELATITTSKVGYETAILSDSEVVYGPGASMTTITQDGGTITVLPNVAASTITTINQNNGTFTIQGSVAVTTWTCLGGTIYDQSSGTIGTLNLYGTYDHRKSMVAKTITTLNMYKGAKFYDPAGVVTVTSGFKLALGVKWSDVFIDSPPNKTWTMT